jgi:hypothetical protein
MPLPRAPPFAGVRLYFDTIRLLFGFSVLGTLLSIPSFYASFRAIHYGAYAGDDPARTLGFPGFIALASLGARTQELDASFGLDPGCTTRWCEEFNAVTASIEAVYALLFLLCVRSFRNYARTMAALDEEENVRIESYSIEIFGFSGLKRVSARDVRAHVQAALRAHAEARKAHYEAQLTSANVRGARFAPLAQLYEALADKWQDFLERKCHRVQDVTLIVHDRGLLRRLVSLAPKEAKVPTLRRKLDIAKRLGDPTAKLEKKMKKAQVPDDDRTSPALVPPLRVLTSPGPRSYSGRRCCSRSGGCWMRLQRFRSGRWGPLSRLSTSEVTRTMDRTAPHRGAPHPRRTPPDAESPSSSLVSHLF